MKVDLMRRVDYWAGIPICFSLTVVHKLGALLGFKKRGLKKPVKNIMFIELSEMGSAILAYSSLQKAKELFPDANIYFLIFAQNQDSVHVLKTLPRENVITISSKSLFAFATGTISALWKIRKKKIDTIIDLELFSRATSILSYLSGAKRRVGYYNFYSEGLYRGKFLTHNVEYNPHQHIAINFLNLVYALKAPIDQVPMLKQIVKDIPVAPRIESSDEERKNILDKMKKVNPNFESGRIVVMNTNAGLLPLRAWGVDNYAKLAKKILDTYPDIYITIMGVKEATRDAEYICKVAPDRCIDLTTRTTLKEVVDLFNVSEVLITNDSGPAHFASLTPIKNFVFFGPETPKLYAPLGDNFVSIYSNMSCSPCVSAYNHRKSPCTDNKCLQVITVDSVFEKIKSVLG